MCFSIHQHCQTMSIRPHKFNWVGQRKSRFDLYQWNCQSFRHGIKIRFKSEISCDTCGSMVDDDCHTYDGSMSLWWRHQMETFSALLAICAGNSLVPGEFSAQRPVTRSFDVFFDLRPGNGWVNNGEAGDSRRHRAQYDVIVMSLAIRNWSSWFCGWVLGYPPVCLARSTTLRKQFKRIFLLPFLWFVKNPVFHYSMRSPMILFPVSLFT